MEAAAWSAFLLESLGINGKAPSRVPVVTGTFAEVRLAAAGGNGD
jgi:hypothetical protein